MNPPNFLDAEEEEPSRTKEPAPATTDTDLPPEPQAPATTETNLPQAPEPVTMERNDHSVVVSRDLNLDLSVCEIDLEVQCFYTRDNLPAFRSNDACGKASETDEKFLISDSEKGSASSAVKCQDSPKKGDQASKSEEKNKENVAIFDIDLSLLNIGMIESSPAAGNGHQVNEEESSAMTEEAGEGAHSDGSEKNII
jgi:hypothetical protein